MSPDDEFTLVLRLVVALLSPSAPRSCSPPELLS